MGKGYTAYVMLMDDPKHGELTYVVRVTALLVGQYPDSKTVECVCRSGRFPVPMAQLESEGWKFRKLTAPEEMDEY